MSMREGLELETSSYSEYCTSFMKADYTSVTDRRFPAYSPDNYILGKTDRTFLGSRTAILLTESGKSAEAVKTDFLNEVLNVLHQVAAEVLSLADSKRINAEVSKLPWNGLNIDWKNQQHQVIDLSQKGAYSSESVSPASLRRFSALQGEKVVMMFSGFEPPVAIAADDFIRNWFDICCNFTFLPKVILISADELAAKNPRIVEIDPMQFFKGHV